MKRQRGRGRKSSNPQNRTFESNGPDVKVRGNASHIYEKYSQLARDAASSGDRVMAENYLQYAEHYYRIASQFAPKREREDHYDRDDHDSSDEGEDTLDTSNEEGEGQEANNGASHGGSRDSSHGDQDGEDNRQERPRRGRHNNNGRGRRRSEDEDQRPRRQPRAEKPNSDSFGDPLAVVSPEGADDEVSHGASELDGTSSDTAPIPAPVPAPAPSPEVGAEEKPKRVRRPRKPRVAKDEDAEAALKDAGPKDSDDKSETAAA
ncbi:DUF4167 domain-containing protein [Woodsholea maritima]|uniref:DUF4167 domain-containing protein n=1 Tax=Woodsholea maritima TaxID=240237 RepID=UPI000360EE59|nr:DUF4167 domain-containing protein [Woodsholea maritima]